MNSTLQSLVWLNAEANEFIGTSPQHSGGLAIHVADRCVRIRVYLVYLTLPYR